MWWDGKGNLYGCGFEAMSRAARLLPFRGSKKRVSRCRLLLAWRGCQGSQPPHYLPQQCADRRLHLHVFGDLVYTSGYRVEDRDLSGFPTPEMDLKYPPMHMYPRDELRGLLPDCEVLDFAGSNVTTLGSRRRRMRFWSVRRPGPRRWRWRGR